MEYARHRRRKKRGRARRQSDGEAGRAIAALLMVAAIVYLISASAAGSWIAEKVVVPVFSAVADWRDGTESHNEESGAEVLPETQQVSLAATTSAVDTDVTLPAITCYALQMGVFSSAENAQAQAQKLQTLGAGGYVLRDGERYRVIAAGYANEADARDVKERLRGEGVDCALYPILTDAATYRVSAEEDQLAQVNAGFAAVANAQSALTEAVLGYDAQKQTPAQGKADASRIAQTLRTDMALLQGYAGEHGALTQLLACYNDCLAAIEDTANSTAEGAAFAAEYKHAQLYVTDRYAQLMNGLGAV